MSDTTKYSAVRALDKGTMVPLGAAAAVVVSMFLGWTSLDGRLANIEMLQHDQGRDLLELRREITNDRWTRTSHRLWVAELRRLNPTLPVPPVEPSSSQPSEHPR